MWSSNRETKVKKYGNSYNWDYNIRYSCHYFQEHGHVLENCIRTHFRSDYKRWLSQTICFSFLKIGHIIHYCQTRSNAPSCEFNNIKGKGKEDVENVRNEMNKIGKEREDCNKSSGEGITSPNMSSDHTSLI